MTQIQHIKISNCSTISTNPVNFLDHLREDGICIKDC